MAAMYEDDDDVQEIIYVDGKECLKNVSRRFVPEDVNKVIGKRFLPEKERHSVAEHNWNQLKRIKMEPVDLLANHSNAETVNVSGNENERIKIESGYSGCACASKAISNTDWDCDHLDKKMKMEPEDSLTANHSNTEILNDYGNDSMRIRIDSYYSVCNKAISNTHCGNDQFHKLASKSDNPRVIANQSSLPTENTIIKTEDCTYMNQPIKSEPCDFDNITEKYSKPPQNFEPSGNSAVKINHNAENDPKIEISQSQLHSLLKLAMTGRNQMLTMIPVMNEDVSNNDKNIAEKSTTLLDPFPEINDGNITNIMNYIKNNNNISPAKSEDCDNNVKDTTEKLATTLHDALFPTEQDITSHRMNSSKKHIQSVQDGFREKNEVIKDNSKNSATTSDFTFIRSKSPVTDQTVSPTDVPAYMNIEPPAWFRHNNSQLCNKSPSNIQLKQSNINKWLDLNTKINVNYLKACFEHASRLTGNSKSDAPETFFCEIMRDEILNNCLKS